MSLGRHQLDLLAGLGAPKLALVVGDKTARSLARRGLLVAKSSSGNGFYTITPTGLRTLADALENGLVKGFDPADFKKDSAT